MGYVTPQAHQEDKGRVPDEGNGRRQLSLVASTVGTSWLVGIFGQLQLLQCPLHHLGGEQESGAHPPRRPLPRLGNPYPGLVLPRDAAEPRVQLQVLPGRELVKQGIKLRAVPQALLDLEQLLEHTGDTVSSAPGEVTPSAGVPPRPARPHLCPLTKASPPVVLSSPVSILKVLVLPAPLTPRRPKHSPGRTPRHSRSTARMLPIFRDLYTWQR